MSHSRGVVLPRSIARRGISLLVNRRWIDRSTFANHQCRLFLHPNGIIPRLRIFTNALQQRSICLYLFFHVRRWDDRGIFFFETNARGECTTSGEPLHEISVGPHTPRCPTGGGGGGVEGEGEARDSFRKDIQNGIPLTAIRSSRLGSMEARVKVSYPLVRFAAFFDTMLLPSVAAGIDWSIYRHDSSDSTRSRVEIPRGLFPLFTEQNRSTMRSLVGRHVDNACPLLIKGATTRLDAASSPAILQAFSA